jgi:hypothetical protein
MPVGSMLEVTARSTSAKTDMTALHPVIQGTVHATTALDCALMESLRYSDLINQDHRQPK